jgi:hypothetical protein
LKELRVAVLYRRGEEAETHLLRLLERTLTGPEYALEVNPHLKIGLEWARQVEEKIRGADVAVALLSNASLNSEMMEYEIEIALDQKLRDPRYRILPIRVDAATPASGAVGALVGNLPYLSWEQGGDDSLFLADLVDWLASGEAGLPQALPPLRTIAPDSPFYIARATDAQLEKCLQEQTSIVLVKGPRQVGKSSLIGQGTRMQVARGGRIATTDFQRFASMDLTDADACYRILAADLARQLKFAYVFDAEWLPVYGPTYNLNNFVRAMVRSSPAPLAWFMDEADRLFTAPFSNEFFALVRAWHNADFMEPGGGWDRLSIVITYATEAHLFIQDLNQSPFNVGVRLELRNFTYEQVQELNERYGAPFSSSDQLVWLYEMVEGHPYLTRQAMDYMVRGGTLRELTTEALDESGPFGDHLRRVFVGVSQLDGVLETMKAHLGNAVVPDSRDVQRLLAAGVLARRGSGGLTIRGKLYREYLGRKLA